MCRGAPLILPLLIEAPTETETGSWKGCRCEGSYRYTARLATMSIAVLNLVWNLKYSTPLSTGQTLVLVAMADTSDDHGFLWPHVSEIVRKTRINERQVRTNLSELEKKGFIRRERRRHGSHLGGYNYWIQLDLLHGLQAPRPTGRNLPVDKRQDPAGSQAAETVRAEPPIENHQEPPNPPKGGNRRIESCLSCSNWIHPGEGVRVPSGVRSPRWRYVHRDCLGSDRYKRVHH